LRWPIAGKSIPVIEICHQTEGTTAAVVVVEARRGSTTELARLLRTAIGSGDVEVVVDLGERQDVSSDLLSVLHRYGRHARALGGTLSVVCSRPELRRLFDVTLLSQGFDVYASRDEALRPWA
jgi:anti-anti-sigma regulatory factor